MTVKQYIIEELKKHPNGLAGGTLERNLEYLPHKPSTVSRVARAMYNEGLLLRREVNGYVEYKLK